MRKLFVILGLVMVASMVLAACQPQTVVETVIIEGTPQVVTVVATAVPEVQAPTLRVNLTFLPGYRRPAEVILRERNRSPRDDVRRSDPPG